MARRVRAFIEEVVTPHEDAHDGDIEAAGGESLRRELQGQARERGLLTPHGPRALGGLGLGMAQRAAVFEEAGRSLFGPLALNINAPDEGNVHLLEHVATDEQQRQFLAPLVRGETRSAFAMTEPSPGAGSDPAQLLTEATRDGDAWVIEGHKHFITGADGAAFHIVMARTGGAPGRAGGATMFLVPADTPGVRLVRHLGTQDRSMLGGHCEIRYESVRVGHDAVLGEVDEGFRYAQVRLGPARMTHVMRWTGAAQRAHEVAVRYAAGRRSFGSSIADQGLAQQLIADNEIDLAATRALLGEACRQLDAGERASHITSVTKTFAAEALHRVVDRAVQLCGGLGVTSDLPVARIAREIRPFRIYDGPSEVHRWSIARRAVRAHGQTSP
ncbi:acyl-CoA dehydrogenase family protein [Nocardioides sp. CBS4Y-1]|uniref:Acyl-CoA dehydrogenase family protein n=1 Tax=Nocardioides acrostichi TaxID=2784339 RepID=A0A930V3R8_9ACTN|nr:acyl-CoA dehydrogenase family protein [Nocardioides acrostichi]